MKRKSRSMRLESLEGRSLMAGDVFASMKVGSLKIEGDSQANDIAVVDLGGGKIEITGRNGTMVNRVAKVTLVGFRSDFKAELKGGDDIFSWSGIASRVPARFGIDTGAGNDSVFVDKLFAGIGKIETGLGNDLVEVLNAKASILEIETGDGDDVVRIGSPSVLTNVSVSNFKIGTGLGNDQVQVQNSNLNTTPMKIELGSGNDKAVVSKVRGSAAVVVSGGFGTDSVVFDDSTCREIEVELGDGNGDDLRLTGVKSLKTKLSGGLGGADKLTRTGTQLGTLKISGFEA